MSTIEETIPTSHRAPQQRPLDLTPLGEGLPERRRRPVWPVAGIVGSLAGFGGAMAALSNGVTEEDAQRGVGVIDQLERGGFHVAFVLGLVSVIALFVAGSGWRRWAEQRAPGSIAARNIGVGITATATINVVFTALAGSMALYLPGGTDHGWLSNDAMFVNFTLLDFGSLLGWWGVTVAALSAVSLAFGRQRLLPRWTGVAAIVLLAPALAAAVITGLPGLVGLTMPIWLTAVSVGAIFGRRIDA